MDCLQDRLNKYQGRSVKGRRYLPRRVLALSRLVAGRWRRVRQRLGADYDGAGARRRGQLHLMAALHYPSPAATTRCQVRVANRGPQYTNTTQRPATLPVHSRLLDQHVSQSRARSRHWAVQHSIAAMQSSNQDVSSPHHPLNQTRSHRGCLSLVNLVSVWKW